MFDYFVHSYLPLNVITNCVGLSWCNARQCTHSSPGLSHLNCVKRPATVSLVQGVLTPFDRLEGYERKVQIGTEAAGASDNGPLPQPTPGAFHSLLPCILLPLSSVYTCLVDLPVMFTHRKLIEAAQALHASLNALYTGRLFMTLHPHTISSDTHAVSCVCRLISHRRTVNWS
jgi:hypothetical protein